MNCPRVEWSLSGARSFSHSGARWREHVRQGVYACSVEETGAGGVGAGRKQRSGGMRAEETGVACGFTNAWALHGRPCDSCNLAAARLFCRADSAFLCLRCDATLHPANQLASRHDRFWLCEVCEQSPASVTCKADAATLCPSCDADIHSANSLARRHERLPVSPFYDPASSTTAKIQHLLTHADYPDVYYPDECKEEAEVASWLLSTPMHKLAESTDYLFPDLDPSPDLPYPSSLDTRLNLPAHSFTESAVPPQPRQFAASHPPPDKQQNCPDPDYSHSKPCYIYNSLCHSVSSSSMESGIVPDGTDNSYRYSGKSAVDNSRGATQTGAPQLSGLDREARVLRYREKRKNRKFEKTIRYASRKAYAEMRPRIKGRFAKRTETEPEVGRMYRSTAVFPGAGYDVVQSF